MAVAHRATSSGTFSASSVTMAEPAGAAQDDILLATLFTETGATVTAPSGWTLHSTAFTGGNGEMRTYWIKRGASAPALQWTFSVSEAGVWVMGAYSGVDGTSPINAYSGTNVVPNASGVSTSGSITPTVNDCMLVGRFAADAPVPNTWSGQTVGGSAATERADVQRGTTGATATSFDLLQGAAAAATAAATQSAAPADVDAVAAVILALKPGAGAVGVTRAVSYDVINTIGATRAVAYDVLNVVGHTRAVAYDVLNAAALARAVVYDVGGIAGLTRAVAYDVRNTVGRTRDVAYDVLATVGVTRLVVYDLLVAPPVPPPGHFAAVAPARLLEIDFATEPARKSYRLLVLGDRPRRYFRLSESAGTVVRTEVF